MWAAGAMVGAFLLLVVCCSGCQTAPSVDTPAVSCEPLPVCSIPHKASSTQLDSALWACVLEYRALYSSCANRRPENK